MILDVKGWATRPATINLTVQNPTSLSIVQNSSSTSAEASCGTNQCGVTRMLTYQVLDQLGQAMQFPMDFWDSISPQGSNGCNLQRFDTTCTPSNTGPCGKVTTLSGQLFDSLPICAPACCNQSTGACVTGCSTTATQTWTVNGVQLSSDVKTLTYKCDSVLINGN